MQVGSVTAEVKECSSSVLDGVGKPWEPLWTDADLFGTFVSVVDDDLADLAELAGLGFANGIGVGGVPGGLVVDEDLNVMLAGGRADGEGVVHGGAEGLLYHGADIVFGGGFDDAAVVLDGGVDEDRVGVLCGEHVLKVRIEEGLWQVISGGILLGEGDVGFDDGDKLGVGVPGESCEEALYVSVNESNDGYPDGFVCSLSTDRGCCEYGEKEEWCEFHGGPHTDCGCWLRVSVRPSTFMMPSEPMNRKPLLSVRTPDLLVHSQTTANSPR